MREFSTPASGPLPTGTLTDPLVRRAREHPDQVLLSRQQPGEPGVWHDVTAAAFCDQVRSVARGLVAAGVLPGDRVALLSRTRYEWTLLDYAVWFAGAVTVPVYETSAAAEVGDVLRDCAATAIVVETADHRARVASVRADLPDLAHVWTLDDDAVADLTAQGDPPERRAELDAEVERRRTAVRGDDVATLIYTSGTTGRPKGCQLTHACFLAETSTAARELPELFGVAASGASPADDEAGQEEPAPATLLFLPLAHVFARVVQVGSINAGVRLGHSGDVTRLVDDLRSFSPTFVLGVPRVFEKLFNTASQRATADGRGTLFDRAVEAAIAHSRALDRTRVPWRLRTRRAVYDRLVYDEVRHLLGGRCRWAVSGGAPLGERLGHFYRGIGIPVLEGYGLTETTAALTLNLPSAQKVGTVGRPLPGTAVRVADDGELLVRGPQVFSGYWHAEQATHDALEPDGWFHTGDLGEVDDEGFVRVTGRKVEIIVTAGGKSVAPAALEERLRSHPLVSQALVVGDRRPYVAALLTVDAEAWPAWAREHGKPEAPEALVDLVDDPDLRAELQHAVDHANAVVSRAEAIRAFAVVPVDWSEEAGQLTPSLKLKRTVVVRECRDEIADLYA